jgi:hypothetical protein
MRILPQNENDSDPLRQTARDGRGQALLTTLGRSKAATMIDDYSSRDKSNGAVVRPIELEPNEPKTLALLGWVVTSRLLNEGGWLWEIAILAVRCPSAADPFSTRPGTGPG